MPTRLLLCHNTQFIGLNVVSSTEFEVILYLNQMGVFNFVDDGSLPGCAVLKLSDGRKRSMSLWVEFITASGYLSARKIRSRFQTLVSSEFLTTFTSAHRNAKRGSDVYDVFLCVCVWPYTQNIRRVRSRSIGACASNGQLIIIKWRRSDLSTHRSFKNKY